MMAFIKSLALLGLFFCAMPAAAVENAVPSDIRADGQFTVLTSFTILADMAQHIAGEQAVIVSITRVGAEIHDYQPTPQDLVRASAADLILWNGLGLERWYERFMQDVQHVKAVTVSARIEPLPIREGGYAGKPNPHAWMSPQNALIYIENIRAALSERDPVNAEIYKRNAEAYAEKFKNLRAELMQSLSLVPEPQRWLVSSEGAFSYLARDLGWREAYLWPINAEQQGTPQQVKKLLRHIRAHKIPVVFSESTISPTPAKQLARESGALYGGVLYVDSLTTKDGAVPTYLDLLRVTTRTISEAFAAAKQAAENP